jgi:hypothetical protein
MPANLRGLHCDRHRLELPALLQTDWVEVEISAGTPATRTKFSAVHQAVQTLETRKGYPFAAIGSAARAGFESPIELLGYNLCGGDGYLWVDLFWRATERHQRTHFLWVHLLDADTGESVTSEEGNIPKYDWREGDLYQERRILWLDDVPPGSYKLGVALDSAPLVGSETAKLMPDWLIMIEAPIEVLPAADRDGLAPNDGATAHVPRP